MTRLAIELGLGALLALWISDATSINFWVVAAGVIGLYFLIVRGWRPTLGAIAPRVGGNIGNLPVNVVIWLGIMLLGTTLIAFSNVEAFVEIMKIGPRPWLWPGGMLLKFLLWVCLAFIAGSAATPNASPRPWARLIFGLGFLVIFTIAYEPRSAEAIRPKPANGPAMPLPGETQAWADYDKAKAENGRIPTYFCITWQDMWGPRWPCAGNTTIGATVKGAISSVLPARTASAATVAPTPVEFPTFGEGHATKTAPIKTWLDPKRTFTRPSGPARYVFAEDSSLFFDDVEGAKIDRTENRKIWQDMPEGKYLVEPLDGGDIFFRWYQ